ncbi:hypothetical protein SSX86_007825 [Deinandra increscens subsp. villosa]|uniref:Ubiquitin-like protease family profile domain-containing protein n=1 Tax=Deinandra increscens subsp. villosa TaxID=3103831 RepID=A0AAP0H642_9ASTR
MGFGQLLTFMVDGVPLKLGHFVVDNFNPQCMVIQVGDHFVKVNRKAIQNLFGVPYGGRKLKDGNPLPSRHPKVVQWRKRYPGKNVPPTRIVRNIRNAPDEDSFIYRMDFVMCFLSVLVECRAQGIEPDPSKNAISFWTMEKLKCRETWETKHGGFGKGKFKRLSKVVDDGSEKLTGFDLSYLVAEVENDIRKLVNVKSNLDHSFYQLKNNFPESPQLKVFQDKYLKIISSGPINSIPHLGNEHVIGADSNPQHDPVVDEQANHSAAESEESDSSNSSQGEPGGDDPDRDRSSGPANDLSGPGVDDRASESSDGGGDNDSPDGHPNSEQSHDDDQSQDNQSSNKVPSADNQYAPGKINKVPDIDEEESDPSVVAANNSVVETSISKDEAEVEDTKTDYQASVPNLLPHEKNDKADIDEEESDPSVVAVNDSVVEPSISKEEALADDTKTVNQASVNNILPHEKNVKVNDGPHHIIASILGELLESINVQSSRLKIQSQQKVPDDQLVPPLTLEDSKDSANPENQAVEFQNLALISFSPTGKNFHLITCPNPPIEAIPITAVPNLEKLQEVVTTMETKRINLSRHTSLNDVSMSTCLHRGVQLEAPLSMDETKIWNLLFKPQQNTMKGKRLTKPQPCLLMPGDYVFCSPTHVELNKEVRQSLNYDKVVDIEVIRAWVDVLNFQELKRSSASPHRVFCPPNLISPWNLHDFSTDVKEKEDSFSANLADYLDRININQHLKGVDLLLLPVEDSDSFYLMVFDLTNPSILVIDSFHSKKPLVRLVDSYDY